MKLPDLLERLRGSASSPEPPLPADEPAPPSTSEPLDDTGTDLAPPARSGHPSIFSRYAVTIFGQPDDEQSYFHGHVDGAFEGDADAFGDFVGHQQTVRTLQRRLEDAEAAEAKAKADLEAGIVLAAEQARCQEEHATATEKLDHLQREEDRLEAEREALEEVGGPSRAGLALDVALYGLAGLAFVAADFVIAHEIVKQALRISGEAILGIPADYLFAAGLAAMPFGVKPLYERWIEEDYMRGNSGRFVAAAALAAGLVVLAVLCVNALRVEHVLEQEARNAAQQQNAAEAPFAWMDPIQEEAAPTGPGNAADGGEALGSPPLWSDITTWALGLTALVFVLVGGMCFGIVSVAVKELPRVRDRDLRRQEAKRGVLSTRSTLQHTETRRDELQALLAAQAVELEERPSPEAARSDLSTARADVRGLRADLQQARTSALRALYRNGFSLAERNLRDAIDPAGPWEDKDQDGDAPEGSLREAGSTAGASGDGAQPRLRRGKPRNPSTGRRPYLDARDRLMRLISR